jgi:transposase
LSLWTALKSRLEIGKSENGLLIVRDIAWKAQVRLCRRYRKLAAAGKKPTVVITAIARELSGFVWAIGQTVRSPMPQV